MLNVSISHFKNSRISFIQFAVLFEMIPVFANFRCCFGSETHFNEKKKKKNFLAFIDSKSKAVIFHYCFVIAFRFECQTLNRVRI